MLKNLFVFCPTGHSRWPKRCGTSSFLRLLRSPRQISQKSIYRSWGGSLSTGTPWMSVSLGKIWCPITFPTTCTTTWPCGPKTSEIYFAGRFDSEKMRMIIMSSFSLTLSGKWPQAVRANGHLLLNSEKVSEYHCDFNHFIFNLLQFIYSFALNLLSWSLTFASWSSDQFAAFAGEGFFWKRLFLYSPDVQINWKFSHSHSSYRQVLSWRYMQCFHLFCVFCVNCLLVTFSFSFLSGFIEGLSVWVHIYCIWTIRDWCSPPAFWSVCYCINAS